MRTPCLGANFGYPVKHSKSSFLDTTVFNKLKILESETCESYIGCNSQHFVSFNSKLALCLCNAQLNQNLYVNSFFCINLLKIR